ncbi:MAG: phosphotransferase, partial [Alphaproteobacteria bacterium]|nr:phosphotransferase [Alphaproteobacteria bacterium]
MDDAVAAGLSRLAPRLDPAATGVADVRRLAGGASQQIWAFRLEGPGTHLILRRSPGVRTGSISLGAAVEADVMARALAAGAPVPRVHATLRPEDGLGDAYVMDYVEGEALPKRI